MELSNSLTLISVVQFVFSLHDVQDVSWKQVTNSWIRYFVFLYKIYGFVCMTCSTPDVQQGRGKSWCSLLFLESVSFSAEIETCLFCYFHVIADRIRSCFLGDAMRYIVDSRCVFFVLRYIK